MSGEPSLAKDQCPNSGHCKPGIDPKQTLLRKRCYAAAVGTRRPLPGAAAHRAAADSQADRRA